MPSHELPCSTHPGYDFGSPVVCFCLTVGGVTNRAKEQLTTSRSVGRRLAKVLDSPCFAFSLAILELSFRYPSRDIQSNVFVQRNDLLSEGFLFRPFRIASVDGARHVQRSIFKVPSTCLSRPLIVVGFVLLLRVRT